jgi:hypothetical protein
MNLLLKMDLATMIFLLQLTNEINIGAYIGTLMFSQLLNVYKFSIDMVLASFKENGPNSQQCPVSTQAKEKNMTIANVFRVEYQRLISLPGASLRQINKIGSSQKISDIIMEENETDSLFGYGADTTNNDKKKSGFLPQNKPFFEQDSEKIIETNKNNNGQMVMSSEKFPPKTETKSIIFGEP